MSTHSQYFNNVDALRFTAFLFVFFGHTFFSDTPSIVGFVDEVNYTLEPYPYLGVSFFFELSSFLLTWLVLNEYELTNSFGLKNFYSRRALRIWPLYFFIIFATYSVVSVFSSSQLQVSTLPNIWWFITFTANYYVAYVSDDFLFFLVFLWTISVEEQFYLLWGILMRYFYNNINGIVVCLFIAHFVFLFAEAAKIIDHVYYDTLNYLPAFALGALLANISAKKTQLFRWLKERSRLFWLLLYSFFFVALYFFRVGEHHMFVPGFRQIAFNILFIFILFDQCFNTNRLFNVGKFKWINYLGKISFGLYCWHGVAITVIKTIAARYVANESYWHSFLIYPAVVLLLVVAISIASYELYERKFLKLKDYFRT